jgi:hypothetical protein
MVLYVGNDNLDIDIDPGFNLGSKDNLVLLAPGPTQAFGDDKGIAFATEGTAVTPASHGVLSDGVLSPSGAANAQPGVETDEHLSIGLLVLAGLTMVVVVLTTCKHTRRF